MFNKLAILAADPILPGAGDPTSAFDNALVANYVQPVFYLIGGAILIMTIWKAVQGFAKADFGKVARTIIGGFIAVLLCFNLPMSAELVGGATNLMGEVVTTISDTLSGDSGGAPATTPGTTPVVPPAPAPGTR